MPQHWTRQVRGISVRGDRNERCLLGPLTLVDRVLPPPVQLKRRCLAVVFHVPSTPRDLEQHPNCVGHLGVVVIDVGQD